MRYTKQQIISGAKIASIALALTLSLNFLAAATWQPPTQNPPQGDVPAPLNDGLGDQTKSGSLRVGGLTSDTVIVAPTSGLTNPVITELLNNPDIMLWLGGKARADDFCLNSDPSKCLGSAGQQRSVVYSVNGNYLLEIPEDFNYARVEVVGAGGGGSDCQLTTRACELSRPAGQGGGGGGYAEAILDLVKLRTLTSNLNVTVGVGGGNGFVSVPPGRAAGAAGSASTVAIGGNILISASGGQGGTTNSETGAVPAGGTGACSDTFPWGVVLCVNIGNGHTGKGKASYDSATFNWTYFVPGGGTPGMFLSDPPIVTIGFPGAGGVGAYAQSVSGFWNSFPSVPGSNGMVTVTFID